MKINSIKKAIEINNPEKEDPIDVLSKVGGLDIAGLVGVFIGGAALNIPIVIDGFISAVAALVAVKICPKVKGYIIPSHLSKDPAAIAIMEELNLKPFIDCNMCLGEGTGAVAVMPLLDIINDNPQYKFEDLEQIYVNVRDAAYHIIDRKKATYYGIGMALTRIVKAILSDENSCLSVSAYLNGQYGQNDVFVGVPAIINRNGVREVFELNITEEEKEKLTKSVNVLKETLATVK